MDKHVQDDLVNKVRNLCRDFEHEHSVVISMIVSEDQRICLVEGTVGNTDLQPFAPGEWQFITPDGDHVAVPGVPLHKGDTSEIGRVNTADDLKRRPKS